MSKVTRSEKLKKYVVVIRENVVHNLDGEDRRKLLSEIYMLKPNTVMSGGTWREYQKVYYREIVGERGTDIGMENAQSYISVSGCVDDLIDLNFKSSALETNNIKVVKTYANNKFMKRDRETSFHREYELDVDEDGNPYMKRVDKNAPQPATPPAPKVKADFSTIPAGSKYLYSRLNTPDGECIVVTDVMHWLQNNSQNDTMISGMDTSLDALAPAGWSELGSTVIEPDDGDFDALEKALQADPDWGSDPTFDQFNA